MFFFRGKLYIYNKISFRCKKIRKLNVERKDIGRSVHDQDLQDC